jgi:hypothetical protein
MQFGQTREDTPMFFEGEIVCFKCIPYALKRTRRGEGSPKYKPLEILARRQWTVKQRVSNSARHSISLPHLGNRQEVLAWSVSCAFSHSRIKPLPRFAHEVSDRVFVPAKLFAFQALHELLDCSRIALTGRSTQLAQIALDFQRSTLGDQIITASRIISPPALLKFA